MSSLKKLGHILSWVLAWDVKLLLGKNPNIVGQFLLRLHHLCFFILSSLLLLLASIFVEHLPPNETMIEIILSGYKPDYSRFISIQSFSQRLIYESFNLFSDLPIFIGFYASIIFYFVYAKKGSRFDLFQKSFFKSLIVNTLLTILVIPFFIIAFWRVGLIIAYKMPHDLGVSAFSGVMIIQWYVVFKIQAYVAMLTTFFFLNIYSFFNRSGSKL